MPRRGSSFIRKRRIAYMALGVMALLLILLFRLAWLQGTAGIHMSVYGGIRLRKCQHVSDRRAFLSTLDVDSLRTGMGDP